MFGVLLVKKFGLDKLKKTSPKLEKSDSKGPIIDFLYDLRNVVKENLIKSDKKTLLGIIGIIVIIVAIALWMGSDEQTTTQKGNNTTNPGTPVKNHFDNGNISFDYPDGWNSSTEKATAPVVVTVLKNGNNSFSVLTEKLGNKNFTDRIIEWRQSVMDGGDIYYEGWTTMDGSRAYVIEATYKTQSVTYNTRGVAIEKYNTAYFIIFIFNTSLLDYKDDMELVINSFHVK